MPETARTESLKTAVVSAAFGDHYRNLSRISFPTFIDYASRIGSDFISIGNRMFPYANPSWEKMQIGNLLEIYDAVLWIDADALVSPNAPSLFSLVPKGTFSAREENPKPDELERVSRRTGIPVVQDRPYGYFNAGVFVAWKETKELFHYVPPRNADIISPFMEQSHLNLRVAALKIPFYRLDPTWNSFPGHPSSIHGNIIHFAGRRRRPDLEHLMRTYPWWVRKDPL